MTEPQWDQYEEQRYFLILEQRNKLRQRWETISAVCFVIFCLLMMASAFLLVVACVTKP